MSKNHESTFYKKQAPDFGNIIEVKTTLLKNYSDLDPSGILQFYTFIRLWPLLDLLYPLSSCSIVLMKL